MADWRFRSRVIAYLDLVVMGVALTVVILFLLGYAYLAFTDVNLEKLLQEQGQEVPTILDWIALGANVLIFIIKFYGALKLKSATEVGKEPEVAREMARAWMVINIVFMLHAVIGQMTDFYRSFYWGFLIGLIFRVYFVYAVYMFRVDLQKKMGEPNEMVDEGQV